MTAQAGWEKMRDQHHPLLDVRPQEKAKPTDREAERDTPGRASPGKQSRASCGWPWPGEGWSAEICTL
jgi:hypothetical protein